MTPYSLPYIHSCARFSYLMVSRMAEAIPRMTQQVEMHGPYGRLPVLARDLKKPKEYGMNALEEMRFEVESENQIHLWMSTGQAEIFGSELSTDRIYTFLKGTKLSIWSWTGCKIQIEGNVDSYYKTKESRVMTMHFNLHNCLEQQRDVAVRDDSVGPRVLVLGAVNTGRSTLCRILLNYAARMRESPRNPLFVDLDFVQPDLAVPGTLACCQFDRPTDPMYDYYYHRKFVLPYGYIDTDANPELLHAQIRRLGDVVEKKFANDPRAKHSGLIINSFAWQKSHNYTHVMAIARAFKVNLIVVVDNERMFMELGRMTRDERQEFGLDERVEVVNLTKSRGVVESNQEERRLHRETRIRFNIYGHPLRSPKHQPFEHVVAFEEILLCNLGNPAISKDILPENVDLIKVKTAAYPAQFKDVNYLVHHVVYVTNVDTPDKVISEGSVIGYLLMRKLDPKTRKLTFLTNFETIPKKVLLVSKVQFKD